ncbi:MAG: PPC domain-containing protein [Phycisphaerae bacterium]
MRTALHRRRPAAIAAAAAAALLLLTAGPRPAAGQALPGHIAHIYPAGGRQGTTVKVTVSGQNLKGAGGVHVSGKGVTGTVETVVLPDAKAKKKDKNAPDRAHLSVTIAPDAAPGPRDLRLITPGGVTNRWRFLVGRLPEILEKEPNDAAPQAQPLPDLPAVANGQIFGADKDRFRFKARAGQTLVVRVQARDMLPFIADAVPGWFQAVLTLYDAATGKDVAYVDDFRFRPDPVLIFEVPKDGEYVAEVRDAIYRGRGDFVYRLTVGQVPFITHVRPIGAKRGTTATVRLFGANLPKQEVTLDLTPPCPDRRWIELDGPAARSNAVPFGVGETPETDEAEPNDAAKKARRLTPPVTVNARIAEPGDTDFYTFTVKAKQTLVLDVDARVLGSPVDTVLTLLDPAGNEEAAGDDYEDPAEPYVTHHADSYLVHTFKKAGDYLLRVRDIQGKGGEAYAYRLTVRPPRPDFRLRVTPSNPTVGRGATTVMMVKALRRDGFTGQIDLSLDGLPDGFEASGTAIPEKFDETILTLTAPRNAPLGTHRPVVTGEADAGGTTLRRRALPAEDVMQAFIYHHLLPTDEMLMTVVEPGPFKLIPQVPEEGFIRFAGGRTAFIDVKAERDKTVKGPIRLALHNPPKGVRMTKRAVIPAGKNTVRCEIRYPNQHPTDVRYTLILRGETKAGKETVSAITPAFLALGPRAKKPRLTKTPTAKTAKKSDPKKPDAKKTEATKPAPKKPAPKKPAPKKPEAQKAEAEKPDAKKP